MNSGATADRVYEALKRKVMANEFRPGERLEPTMLADQLMSSVTPVRDALHRLVGERMIETRSGTGFHLVGLNEPDLRDLYAWNAHLLAGTTRWWRSAPPPYEAPPLPADRVEATRCLFGHIGDLSGNRETRAAIDSVSDRMGAVREIEPKALGSLTGELESLVAALGNGPAEFARQIRTFHRRRLGAVPALVRTAYRAD